MKAYSTYSACPLIEILCITINILKYIHFGYNNIYTVEKSNQKIKFIMN